MLTPIDAAVLAVCLAFFLGFGMLLRSVRPNFSEYATAGKRVPTTVLYASLCATAIGPGFSLGLAGKASQSGFLFLLIFAAFSLQFFLVGRFVAPRLRRFADAQTLGDIVAAQFDVRARHLIGFASVLLCTGLVAVMAKVGAVSLGALLGWPTEAGIVVITVLGVLCAVSGGLNSVIATEAIQYSVKTGVIAALALMVSMRPDVADITAFGIARTESAMRDMGAAGIIGLCVTFAFGELLIPPYANRALAAKTESQSGLVFMLAGGFSLLWFLLVCFLGMYAGYARQNAVPDMSLISVGQSLLPAGGIGLLGAVIFAVILSSQASVLNAGATSFAADLMPAGAASNPRTVAQLATVGMGCIGALLSLWSPTIVDGLILAYTFWVPIAVAPLLFAAFQVPVPRASGAVAMVVGALTALAAEQMHLFEGAPVLIGLLASAGWLFLQLLLPTTRRA